MKTRSSRLMIVVVVMAVAGLFAAVGFGEPACSKCASVGGESVKTQEPVKEVQALAEINTATLETLIRSGVSLVILDARTGKFDDGKRITGAKSLGPQASEEEVKSVVASKDQLIVTYCSNLHCPASRMLAEHLKSLGYVNILEYPDGIAGWISAGKAVVEAAK